MGNCSGKCDSCGDKKPTGIINIGKGRVVYEDSHSLLHPPKENMKRLYSLEGICEHYEFGKVSKSQCVHCIREWINTISIEDAEQAVLEFRKVGRNIAADRIIVAIKERKWNERKIR